MKHVTASVHHIQFTFFVVIFVFRYVSELLFSLLIMFSGGFKHHKNRMESSLIWRSDLNPNIL